MNPLISQPSTGQDSLPPNTLRREQALTTSTYDFHHSQKKIGDDRKPTLTRKTWKRLAWNKLGVERVQSTSAGKRDIIFEADDLHLVNQGHSQGDSKRQCVVDGMLLFSIIPMAEDRD